MRALFTVFGKEFLENLRDRRTLVSALLFGPLFGPLLFGLMVSRMLNQSVVESDEPLRLTISGGDNAPGLTRYLEAQGVKLTRGESVGERGARRRPRRRAQVVLHHPARNTARGSPRRFRRPCCCSRTARIRKPARARIARRLILGSYGSTIAQLRLQSRGVNPLLAVPVAVNEVDVATPTGRAVVVLGFMTYFVLFAVLMGGLVSGHRYHGGGA